jgi:hypothetical protein
VTLRGWPGLMGAGFVGCVRQVKSPDRTLNFEEFKTVAKKFPNTTFPSVQTSNEEKPTEEQKTRRTFVPS